MNQKLKKIGLTSNLIGDEGAKAIEDSLKVNKTLKEIDLDNNKIGPESANAIKQSL